MHFIVKDELPFLNLTVAYHGATIELQSVLLDTGSATTVLSVDQIAPIGIVPEAADVLNVVRGVGGTETVFARQVDYVQVGSQRLEQFEIEVGALDYGFEINGILGMDFLTKTGALINLRTLEIEFPDVD